MKSLPTLTISIIAALALSACAGARYVLIEPTGGVVAVPANTPANHAKAEELMARKCPNGYDIVREEEAIVGTIISGETEQERDRVMRRETVTRDVSIRNRTEWRMKYVCR